MKRHWLSHPLLPLRAMKGLPTTTLLAVSLLLSASLLLLPLIRAQAASLEVNGGVLQTWVFDVDIEHEPAPTAP